MYIYIYIYYNTHTTTTTTTTSTTDHNSNNSTTGARPASRALSAIRETVRKSFGVNSRQLSCTPRLVLSYLSLQTTWGPVVVACGKASGEIPRPRENMVGVNMVLA